MASSADIIPDFTPVTFGIVVGEESGDILGAGLVTALKQYFPNAKFEGIGGPRMEALGFQSFFPQDRLAVMGLVEPLKRLPELLNIRKRLREHFKEYQPAAFIGIDAPDFNLGLEKSLRTAGVKTVHYVSPSVWAWRQGRVKTIAKAVDLMLTLLPFEKKFYDDHQVHAEFVGHPLADQIPLVSPHNSAREALGLSSSSEHTMVALLPGSRANEVERLAPVFLQAARCFLASKPDTLFLLPAANGRRLQQLKQILAQFSDVPVRLLDGQSHQAMAAADLVLMASGTTSLEALLLKRPMVIAYKMAAFSYWLIKKLAKVKYVGLPNLLSSEPLVPEFIQDRATPEALCEKLLQMVDDAQLNAKLQTAFLQIHLQLKQNASARAAFCIRELVSGVAK